MEEESKSSSFSAGAWPLALTVTIGLFVFKHAPGSAWADISYWLVFAPVLLLVGAGLAATLLLGVAGRLAVRSAEKNVARLEEALYGPTERLDAYLASLDEDQVQALMALVGAEYVRRAVPTTV